MAVLICSAEKARIVCDVCIILLLSACFAMHKMCSAPFPQRDLHLRSLFGKQDKDALQHIDTLNKPGG